ncbi:MAG: TetR/AcrR family transcriptional regulator [Panacagrimonas sp.]
MARKIPTRKPPDRYHHGDLRAALVRAGLEMLRKEGIEGLSLRGVARRAGVSQTAPYTHFADMKDLFSAIAAEGDQLLRDAMKAGFESSTDPMEQSVAMAQGYIRFACTEPGLYGLMMGPRALPGRRLAVGGNMSQTTNAAFAEGISYLFRVVAGIVGKNGNPMVIGGGVIASWCLVHGMSSLLIDEQISHSMMGLKDRDALVRFIASFFRPPG